MARAQVQLNPVSKVKTINRALNEVCTIIVLPVCYHKHDNVCVIQEWPQEIMSSQWRCLSKLDEQAENRAEERERRRMLLEAELEEKRREQERKWIQTMLMSK